MVVYRAMHMTMAMAMAMAMDMGDGGWGMEKIGSQACTSTIRFALVDVG